jgi:hypothetical protein
MLVGAAAVWIGVIAMVRPIAAIGLGKRTCRAKTTRDGNVAPRAITMVLADPAGIGRHSGRQV